MQNSPDNIAAAAEYIRSRVDVPAGATAIVCGSGLSTLVDSVENPTVIPYGDVPNMPVSTVPLHKGRFVIGTIAGKPVIFMQGRIHSYEGYTAQQIAFPVYVMRNLGAERLVVTNAAGGINFDFNVGDIMVIEDQINFLGTDPCIGPANEEIYPRYFDMTDTYTPALRKLTEEAAADLGLPLQHGVYMAESGPSFETPAEIRAFRTMGADAIGMSTVLEVIAARSCGMQILGLSMISNPAAGVVDEPLSIDDVLEAAAEAAKKIESLIVAVIERL